MSNRKRLLEENKLLQEKVKVLEKKEIEMQHLNVNLKRDNDIAIATLNQKHATKINNMELSIEKLHKHEQRLKQELEEEKKKVEEKKKAVERNYNKWLAAQGEVKELHHQIAQMEDKNRHKKNN
jgi:hypothetical protein